MNIIYLNKATNLTKNLLVHVLNRVLFCFVLRYDRVKFKPGSRPSLWIILKIQYTSLAIKLSLDSNLKTSSSLLVLFLKHTRRDTKIERRSSERAGEILLATSPLSIRVSIVRSTDSILPRASRLATGTVLLVFCVSSTDSG